MKISKISILLTCALSLSGIGSAFAEEVVVDRPTRVAQIQAQWNPIFDVQYKQLTALEAKAKLDASVYKSYKFLLADFLEVRRVIDAALVNPTGDLTAAAAYAEEETGEFMTTIPEIARMVAKIKTISCVKGKVTKKVSGLTPKCPSGYKKK